MKQLYYTICPTSTDDLNWSEWLIFAHPKKAAVSEDVIGNIHADWVDANPEIYRNDVNWHRKFMKHMESLGYISIQAVGGYQPNCGLNWGISEH